MKPQTFGLALFLLLTFSSAASQAKAATVEPELASDQYLEYLNVLLEAEQLQDIVPYWADWMAKSAKKRTREELADKLTRLQQEAADRTKVYISGAEGNAKKTTLRVGGRATVDEHGEEIELYLTGEVVMVRQKGRWVIDSESWWSE